MFPHVLLRITNLATMAMSTGMIPVTIGEMWLRIAPQTPPLVIMELVARMRDLPGLVPAVVVITPVIIPVLVVPPGITNPATTEMSIGTTPATTERVQLKIALPMKIARAASASAMNLVL